MKVIGTGVCRTGTMSLKAALEELGFGPCYHMTEVFKSSAEIDKWYALATQPNHAVKDWGVFFEGWNSCCDMPCCCFWRDICAAFPDALVVHTVRDPQTWYESTFETVYSQGVRQLFPMWLRAVVPWTRKMYVVQQKLLWQDFFGGKMEEREQAIQIFNKHTEEVRAGVPAERLLVFNAKEGWGPLCKFLKVPVPDTPFPRVNDRQQMNAMLRSMRWKPRVAAAVLVTLVAVLINYCAPALRKYV